MNGRVTPPPLARLLALLLLGGCGAGNSGQQVAPSPAADPREKPPAGPRTPDAGATDAQSSSADGTAAAGKKKGSRHMGVRGITGSLNRGDVQHVMEGRTEALLQCMQQRPRGLRWVGGRIDFRIAVGPDGRVTEARPVHSTIGYRPLERCLTEVIEQTLLPAPDGRDCTEVDWGMSVDPDRGRETAPMDPEDIQEAMKQYSGETYKSCKVRRRTRFQVTAYAGRRGKVLAASALPLMSVTPEKLDCMLEAIKGWRLPAMKTRTKATFTLRWKPPPKSKRYAKRKRRSRHRRGKR